MATDPIALKTTIVSEWSAADAFPSIQTAAATLIDRLAEGIAEAVAPAIDSGGGVTLGSATPLVASGSGTPGSSPSGSHQDHVHPVQTTVAALQTPRNIAGVAFDGSASIAIPFSGLTGGIDDTQHGNRGNGSLHSVAVAGGNAGFLSGSDKSKLDGISSGATVGVTAVGSVGAGNAAALSIAGTTLTAHVATATQPGVVAAADQDLGTFVRSVGAVELQSNTPSAPAAGKARIFAKTRGMAEAYLRYVNNVSAGVQPRFGHRRVIMVRPRGAGDTVIDAWGTLMTNTGAATAPALATTNLLTATPRQTYTANAGTTIACEVRENTLRHWVGNAAGLGGFYMVARFGFSVQSASNADRWLCGFGTTTGTYAAASDPSSAINFFGIGKDSADSTVQFLHNDATGACTKSDSLITPPTTSQLMDLHLYCPPNSSSIEIFFEILNGGSSATYTASTNLPGSGVFNNFHCWHGSGTGNTTQVAVDFVSLYVEADN